MKETPETLLESLYQDLRRLAVAKLRAEPAGATLSPTVLVHEAWLRLGGAEASWDGRGHFYSAAAEAMRRILIDQARRRKAARNGGGLVREELEGLALPEEGKSDEILAIHEALDALEQEQPRKAELVKLRYFAGLTGAEAAAMLGISEATAERDWTFARAWLRRKMAEDA